MQETFAEYTARTAFERPLLSGVAYAQRVVDSEREQFEKLNGWTIRTMEREPSPIRDEYAPVIFSQETVSYIESLDMMSGEVILGFQFVTSIAVYYRAPFRFNFHISIFCCRKTVKTY